MQNGKLIIFSAPSGSGKTTIVKRLLSTFPQFEFSISATSRQPRGEERNGVDYFFLTQEEFRQKVAENAFVEWEEVYNGTCYGTLRSEMERIWAKGNVIIFDVDVMGGINLKRIFGERACSIFIKAPSVEALRERLIGRGTDSAETIESLLQSRLRGRTPDRDEGRKLAAMLQRRGFTWQEIRPVLSRFLSGEDLPEE